MPDDDDNDDDDDDDDDMLRKFWCEFIPTVHSITNRVGELTPYFRLN